MAEIQAARRVVSEHGQRFDSFKAKNIDLDKGQVPERRGAKLLQVSLAGMDRRVPLLAVSEHMLAVRTEMLRKAGLPDPLAEPRKPLPTRQRF